MLSTLEIVGLVYMLFIYIFFIIPPVTTSLKRLYLRIDPLTLDNRRMFHVALIYGVILSLPSAIFAWDEVQHMSSPYGPFFARYMRMFGYIIIPIFINCLRPLAASPFDIFDFLCLCTIFFPLFVHNLWPHFLYEIVLPHSKIYADFNTLYLTAGALILLQFAVLRPLPDTGMAGEMRLVTLWDLRIMLTGVFGLAAVIPVVVGTNAVSWPLSPPPHIWLLINFVTIFFFLAFPLELFFRGAIQNLMHARLEVYRDVLRYTSVDTDHLALGLAHTHTDGDADGRRLYDRGCDHVVSYESFQEGPKAPLLLSPYRSNKPFADETKSAFSPFPACSINSLASEPCDLDVGEYVAPSLHSRDIALKPLSRSSSYNGLQNSESHDTFSFADTRMLPRIDYALNSHSQSKSKSPTQTHFFGQNCSLPSQHTHTTVPTTIATSPTATVIDIHPVPMPVPVGDLEDVTYALGAGVVDAQSVAEHSLAHRHRVSQPDVSSLGVLSADAIESPQWHSWKERYAQTHNGRWWRWWALPSWADALIVVVAAAVYALALMRAVVVAAHEDDNSHDHTHNRSARYGLAFALLFWHGIVCGYVWRMTSQVWCSALLTTMLFFSTAYFIDLSF